MSKHDAGLPELPDNPWRIFIENCIAGDNYFRASEYRELLADLDRLYALTARASQPGEWRPIESAPRDGTNVLLFGPGWREPGIGRWNEHFEEWEENGCGLVPTATLWQPLPAAPQPPKEGGT